MKHETALNYHNILTRSDSSSQNRMCIECKDSAEERIAIMA